MKFWKESFKKNPSDWEYGRSRVFVRSGLLTSIKENYDNNERRRRWHVVRRTHQALDLRMKDLEWTAGDTEKVHQQLDGSIQHGIY